MTQYDAIRPQIIMYYSFQVLLALKLPACSMQWKQFDCKQHLPKQNMQVL